MHPPAHFPIPLPFCWRFSFFLFQLILFSPRSRRLTCGRTWWEWCWWLFRCHSGNKSDFLFFQSMHQGLTMGFLFLGISVSRALVVAPTLAGAKLFNKSGKEVWRCSSNVIKSPSYKMIVGRALNYIYAWQSIKAQVAVDSLRGSSVALYFAGQWCPMVRFYALDLFVWILFK